MFLRILTALVLSLLIAGPVAAQLLPGATSGADNAQKSSIESIVREAERNGSTVIVLSPGQAENTDNANETNSMRAQDFLRARTRLIEVVSSAPTLFERAAVTFDNAFGEDGLLMVLRALITAFVGLFIAKLLIKPVQNWTRTQFSYMYDPDPQTPADKMKYLLFRALAAVVYAAMFFAIAVAFAVVLDPGLEAARRIIFETIVAYCLYRLLRYAVSWNLFAADVPTHRMVNLTDEQAHGMHRDWWVANIITLFYIALARFFSITAEEQITAGQTNGLTTDHILFLQISTAVFIIVVVAFFTIRHWRGWQSFLSPKDPTVFLYKPRTTLARLMPVIWLLYSVFALGAFTYRLLLGAPAPGMLIAAPYIAMWGMIVASGIALILIQTFYQRRERRFRERYQRELERHREDVTVIDEESGEEMIVNKVAMPDFEFQPAFRSFFENSAVAIIIAVALGELGRVWGIQVGERGNWWASFLDIGLVCLICWFGYSAVTTAIDRRLEAEGGMPVQDDEEMGGEGGGAGATRMATLLPIFRYVMTFLILAIAIMVVLSGLGFDIGPIFAGAGVVGIAVGFGAQTLIRDIFSGAFFLLDDAFRKGEYVEIDNIRGTVEKISIRSFQLRHHLGALHTIPFGEIRQLTNYSRDWVMMKLPLRVTYDTDVDRVRKLVKKLGQELLNHPQVGHTFLQPLKSQGVYKMEDSAMIIRVKFMTKPGEQFVTRKVVYESIQDLFAREGIKFAHKEVTVRLADGKDADELTPAEKRAVSAAARSVIDEEAEAAAPANADDGR